MKLVIIIMMHSGLGLGYGV